MRPQRKHYVRRDEANLKLKYAFFSGGNEEGTEN